MATATSRVGLRSSRDLTQAPVRVLVVPARLVTEVAPTTSNRRRYVTHDQLRMHLADFLAAYNFARKHPVFTAAADP